jgi:hypothetical protein
MKIEAIKCEYRRLQESDKQNQRVIKQLNEAASRHPSQSPVMRAREPRQEAGQHQKNSKSVGPTGPAVVPKLDLTKLKVSNDKVKIQVAAP